MKVELSPTITNQKTNLFTKKLKKSSRFLELFFSSITSSCLDILPAPVSEYLSLFPLLQA